MKREAEMGGETDTGSSPENIVSPLSFRLDLHCNCSVGSLMAGTSNDTPFLRENPYIAGCKGFSFDCGSSVEKDLQIEKRIRVDGTNPVVLFGFNDAHLRIIEERFDVSIVARGESVLIRGEGQIVDQVEKVLKELVSSSSTRRTHCPTATSIRSSRS
jgi:hypothetical protein